MALGIDPDSPHVTTLRAAIEDGVGRDMPMAQVIGHLALLHDNAWSDQTSKAISEVCKWPYNEKFLVRLLIGTGWIVHRDGVFSLGPAWDYVATDWE